MAKRKRSVALFEVIHNDKRFANRGGTLPAPSWWNKAGSQAAAKAAPVSRRIMPAAPPVPVAQPIAANPGAVQADAGDSWPAAKARERLAPLYTVPRQWFGKHASLFTPASLGIIGGSLAVVLTMLLLAHWRRSNSVQAILNGPPHPEVLDIASPRSIAKSAAIAQPTLASSTQPPSPAANSNARQLNQGYVMIHLYQTLYSSTNAAAYLNAHDIPCTVEHGIPGIEPRLYAIIGLTPFAHAGTTDYAKYILRIKDAYAKMPGASSSARSFKPQWFKWTAASPQGQAG
jgi:hypothetical protein